VGIGLCEEAIVLVKYFIETMNIHNITLDITGSDISDVVISRAQSNVTRYDFGNYIKIIHEDLLVADVLGQYHIVYTSAAVNDLFNWKLLYYALKCDATHYLFSKTLCDTYKKRNQKALEINFKRFCKGQLNVSGESRDIFCLSMPELKAESNPIPKLVSYVSALLWAKFNTTLTQGIWNYLDRSRMTRRYPISLRWQQLDLHQTFLFLNDILRPMEITEHQDEAALKQKINAYFTKQYRDMNVFQKIMTERPTQSQASESEGESESEARREEQPQASESEGESESKSSPTRMEIVK
jgi:hypothetical protein